MINFLINLLTYFSISFQIMAAGLCRIFVNFLEISSKMKNISLTANFCEILGKIDNAFGEF